MFTASRIYLNPPQTKVDSPATAKLSAEPLSDERLNEIIASHLTITDANLYGAIYMMLRELEETHGIKEQAE